MNESTLELEADLRRVLRSHAAYVRPSLTAVTVRRLADHRRSWAERLAPMIAAAVILAIAALFATLAGGHGARSEPVVPAGTPAPWVRPSTTPLHGWTPPTIVPTHPLVIGTLPWSSAIPTR